MVQDVTRKPNIGRSSCRHKKALLSCILLPLAYAGHDSSESANLLREMKATADAMEGRLSTESATRFHRIRLQLESTFEAERWARHEAVEAQLDNSLAKELESLVALAMDDAIPSGISELDFGKFAPESFPSSIRRLHNETAEPEMILCAACKEEVAELLPLAASLPIIGVLVCLSGLFSGLTLGLMGLDMTGLQIVAKGGDEQSRINALRIMPVRESGNQLLCTLLLGNVAVNSALSILTAEIFSGLVGFLTSTALIVVFGEILPQAACSRYALQVGACTVPIVNLLMGMFYIFTKPMSIVLDCILGREVGTVYTKSELQEMLKLQISMGAVDKEAGDMARQVAEGAISFRDKEVKDVMTPVQDAYMLSMDTVLGYDLVREIFQQGYSRVPVYGKDKHDYRGLLYTKDLMLVDPEDDMKVGDFMEIFNRKVETFWEETKLVECLNTFKKGGTHMGLVRKVCSKNATHPTFSVEGVLTLEDVMEEILQEEIVDETDVYFDVEKRLKVFGRDEQTFDLAIFNPVWRRRQDRLGDEEVRCLVAHLARAVFVDDAGDSSGLHLSTDALQWFISSSEVICRRRMTPVGNEEPWKKDEVYEKARSTENATLVLQGRMTVRVGHECFRSEAGAFTLLAKDALRPGTFRPDFDAHLSTSEVRYLVLKRSRYQEAQALDRNKDALKKALQALSLEAAGASSRKEARAIRQRGSEEEYSPRKIEDPWYSEGPNGRFSRDEHGRASRVSHYSSEAGYKGRAKILQSL